MDWKERKEQEEQQRILETGGNQTVFSVSHSDIKERGTTMCKNHIWKKLSDMEVACTVCPTALIVNTEVLESLITA